MAPREDVMVALDTFLESEPLKKSTQPGEWDVRVLARSMTCPYSSSCSPMHGVYHQGRRLAHSHLEISESKIFT